MHATAKTLSRRTVDTDGLTATAGIDALDSHAAGAARILDTAASGTFHGFTEVVEATMSVRAFVRVNQVLELLLHAAIRERVKKTDTLHLVGLHELTLIRGLCRLGNLLGAGGVLSLGFDFGMIA